MAPLFWGCPMLKQACFHISSFLADKEITTEMNQAQSCTCASQGGTSLEMCRANVRRSKTWKVKV